MKNVAPSASWLGLRAKGWTLVSILALLALAGTVPVHGEEAAPPGRAARCRGADCASPPLRGVTVYRGLVLDYEVIDGLAVHGGDMILGTAEEAAAAAPSREPAQRTASPGSPGDLVRRDIHPIRHDWLWPDGRVPYAIDEGIEGEALEAIHAAIKEWNSKTVVAWFPRTDEQEYALFRSPSGCSSGVGRGSPTYIYSCGSHVPSVLHEMGHAVGLLHEFTRPDRDKFIAMAPGLFSPGFPFFPRSGPWTYAPSLSMEQAQRLEESYNFDYQSIMHYGTGSSHTIPPGIQIPGASRGVLRGTTFTKSLSAGDIDGLAKLYGMHPHSTTVSTNPEGLKVIVDGLSVITPAIFDWLPDSVHTLEAPLLQHETRKGARDLQYVFGSWSDGGGRKHTVKAGPDSTWFEANLIVREEVRHRGDPPNVGTVALSPESPDGRYELQSTRIELTPIPSEGTLYEFARWGNYWSTPPPQDAVVGRRVEPYDTSGRLSAYFRTPPFYRISSNIEGARFRLTVNDESGRNLYRGLTPAAFQPSELPAGSKVSVPEFVAGWDGSDIAGRYRFIGWSDSGEREHEIEVPAEGGSLTFHMQREFQLTTHTNNGEIIVSPASEDGFYPVGSQVQLTAMPAAGYHFLGWEHEVSGTETTQFVIMDRDRRASAKFARAEPILVQSGEPLQVDSLRGSHFVRVPDGTSQVAIRFDSSAPPRNAEFYVSAFSGSELGSTRLRESDTITLTREVLSRLRDRARALPRYGSHHLRIRPRGPGVGSGQLHVSIQRDWIADIWPRAFTMVAPAGWPRPVRQTMRIAPVEGELPPVRYRIVSDQPWLEAVPAEWTSAEGEVEIAVTAHGAALTAEAYGGKLKILAVRAGDPPTGGTPTGLEIPVHFVVMPAEGTEEPPGDGSGSLGDGDDHGDRRGAATEIAAGTATQGRLERVGDEDWFRFRTTGANTWVTAYTVSTGDTVGELHAAGGTVVADDDSGSDGNFRVLANVPAGTHYVRVSGFGTPAYTLRLEADSDDHGDTKGTATEIEAGTAARGRLQAAGDEDWFRFRTTGANTWITASTVSEGDTVGALHLAGGTVVADDDSGSDGNFRVLANVPAGTHYVRVSGFGTPAYTLRLEAEPDLMEFVRIEAGSFLMGFPERQHEVRIRQGFWLGKYEVTQREWEAVMGTNPSRFSSCGRCPVERVSWNDTQEFIRRLNELESGRGYVYRLPTEAEWEYAARAGTTGARYGELGEIAWYDDNSGGETHPGGEKQANAWGLHDMLGNVWEWVGDWFGEYPSGAVTDPRGPGTGSRRVIRGSCWSCSARSIRAEWRASASPGRRDHYGGVGFRLVRTK